jgi:myo-inositol 2-dehydrogenase/D-chiro-inositol 1-dehydrogenase
MTPFRVGIVGIGSMGLLHHQALARLGVEVVSVMSRQKERGFAIAQQIGASYCRTLDELAKTGIDVAIVATPTASHAEILQGLIERGIRYIFCEKPLTRTLQEAQQVAELCRKKKVTMGIGYKMRFEGAFRMAREMITQERIGGLQFLTFNYFQTTPPQPWYLESGVVSEILSHVIDLCNWLAGIPQEVICQVQNFQGGGGEDRAQLTIHYRSGVVASINGGWIRDYPELPGKQRRNICFQFIGEKGYLVGIRGLKLFLCSENHEETVAVEPGDAVLEELQAFLEAISESRTPPVGLEEALAVQAVIESALRGALSGQKERVPLF